MKSIMNVFAVVLTATAIACGGAGTRNSDQRSGHDVNEPTKSVPGEPRVAPTALVGCLRAGEQAGTYTLTVTGDTPDRAGKGTSGSSVTGRPAPAASSTTGAGGDAVIHFIANRIGHCSLLRRGTLSGCPCRAA